MNIIIERKGILFVNSTKNLDLYFDENLRLVIRQSKTIIR